MWIADVFCSLMYDPGLRASLCEVIVLLQDLLVILSTHAVPGAVAEKSSQFAPSLRPPAITCVVAALVATMSLLIELWDRTSLAAIMRGPGWTACCVLLDTGLAVGAAALLRSGWDAAPLPDMSVAGAIFTGIGVGLAPTATVRLRVEARNRLADIRWVFAKRVIDVHARWESRNVERWASEIAGAGTPAEICERVVRYFEVGARTAGHDADDVVDEVRRAVRRAGRGGGSEQVRVQIVRALLDNGGAALVHEMRHDAAKGPGVRLFGHGGVDRYRSGRLWRNRLSAGPPSRSRPTTATTTAGPIAGPAPVPSTSSQEGSR